MSLIEYVERKVDLRLSNLQLDALGLLEQNYELWHCIFKPETLEIQQVLDIHKEWKECYGELVAC